MKKLIAICGIFLVMGTFLSVAHAVDRIPGAAAKPTSYFYTGKPYDKDTEAYVFTGRSYNPETSRWTTPDPSGFPDGANNNLYCNDKVTYAYDLNGFELNLIAGLDITVSAVRNGGFWSGSQQVNVTDTKTLYASTDTQLIVEVRIDPYSASAEIQSTTPPWAGMVVDSNSGELYPNASPLGIGPSNTQGGNLWNGIFFAGAGGVVPVETLTTNLTNLKVGGTATVVVLYNPSGAANPLSWTWQGNILE
jgi:RHS repeat-associated protein